MKTCYILYPHSLKVLYILKNIERKGFLVKGVNIYDDQYLLETNQRVFLYFACKQMTNKELDDFEKVKYIELKTKRDVKNNLYLKNIEIVKLKDISFKQDDIVISFDERFLFEASVINNKFMSRRKALIYSCKHKVYEKIGKEFFKIRNLKDFDCIPEDKYILKPSLSSSGKRNVFIMENSKDYKKILDQDPEIFSLNRIFILEKYIKNVCEIWAMTLFDSLGKPYILWFSTEKNHATFSVFEDDLYKEITIINNKLNIKNWMAYMQFLLDENGKLHFVDLNPRLPGDDHWHEILYRYMTGKSFSKVIVDLIIDQKAPEIIKTNRYIREDEYDPNIPIKRNQKLWEYSDNYKQKPLLTFKKLDL